VYCDLEGLQALGGGSIPVSVMAQTQRPHVVMLDRLVYGRHRISLVELTCLWDTDADKVRDHKISRYAGLKEELSNQGWDCGLSRIEGARRHISKVVKDSLWYLFWSWVPPGQRFGVAQMIKYASWIFLVCSFSIFQAHNDPVWITPSLVSHHIDGVPADK
jgi:CCR4-NOT transcriptional regulation complex NOT5 subunit